MSLRSNPSRNKSELAAKQKYGYVIRVPVLPEAHAGMLGLVAFLETDKRFYRCNKIETNSELYYKWQPVTTGTSRTYLIPIGKLSEEDILRGKNSFDHIIGTVNELVFGFRRYNIKQFEVCGYTEVSGTFQEHTDYYKWHWNEEIMYSAFTLVDNTLHPTYEAGEVYYRFNQATKLYDKLVPGVDYEIGANIFSADLVCQRNTSGYDHVFIGQFIKLNSDEIIIDGEIPAGIYHKNNETTKEYVVDRVNEIVDFLNDTNAEIMPAEIPEWDEDRSLYELCEVINQIIDHVNPFALSWQVVMNTLQNLEEISGNFSELQEAWEGTYNFGTVCQAVDATLRKLQQIEGVQGEITEDDDSSIDDVHSLLTSDEMDEFVLINHENTLAWHFIQHAAVLKSHDLALTQLRKLVGLDTAIAFSPVTGNVLDGTVYYTYDETKKFFSVLENVEVGQPLPQGAYVATADTVAAMIHKNVQKIAEHAGALENDRTDIDKIIADLNGDEEDYLGIYIETLEKIGSDAEEDLTEEHYYRAVVSVVADGEGSGNKKIEFVEIDSDELEEKTTAELHDAYGPIYVKVEFKTIADQIQRNNKEIAEVKVNLSAKYKELRERHLANIQKLLEITGISFSESDAKDQTLWSSLGYTTTTDSYYHKDKAYFKYDSVAKEYIPVDQSLMPTDKYIVIEDPEVGTYVKTLITEYGSDIYTREGKGTAADPYTFKKVTSVIAKVTEGVVYAYIDGKAFDVAATNIFERDVSHSRKDTHRGLIDLNTKSIESVKKTAQTNFDWTKTQMGALQNFMMALTISTIIELVEETTDASTLHDTLNKFILVHNALDILSGASKQIEPVKTDNYTVRDLCLKVNELLELHMDELANVDGFIELPRTYRILEGAVYYRPTDWWHQKLGGPDGNDSLTEDEWYEYVWHDPANPSVYKPDPKAYGQTVAEYDPEGKWYLKFARRKFRRTTDTVFAPLGEKVYFSTEIGGEMPLSVMRSNNGNDYVPGLSIAGWESVNGRLVYEYDDTRERLAIDTNNYTFNDIRIMLNFILSLHHHDDSITALGAAVSAGWNQVGL